MARIYLATSCRSVEGLRLHWEKVRDTNRCRPLIVGRCAEGVGECRCNVDVCHG